MYYCARYALKMTENLNALGVIANYAYNYAACVFYATVTVTLTYMYTYIIATHVHPGFTRNRMQHTFNLSSFTEGYHNMNP